MKNVDLDEPISFLDHVFGCTQCECKPNKTITDEYRKMFESRISAGARKDGCEGHAQKCVDIYCDLANKKTEQLYTVSAPCLDDHNSKKEELGSVGELSRVCSQIVLKCLYLARIVMPDILWSVNKLARSITKWTKACDKRLNRLILTFIIHVNTNNIVMWVTLQTNAE